MAAGVPSAIGAKRAVNPRSKHLLRITSEEAQYEGARGTRLELGRRKPDAPKKIGTTIGNFIDAVREKTAILPKMIESYALALRKIAADIAGLSGGSRDAWDVKLSRLTPEAIEAWRIGFIRRKAVNPLAEKSAKVSASSFILRARSVFSAETVARVSEIVEMPELLPFAGVKVERVRVARDRSSFDMAALLQSARQELAAAKPAIQNLPSSCDGRALP